MAATNRLFANLISGTLDTGIDNIVTTISGAFLAELPVIADPDYIALAIDPEEVGGAGEIVWVTAHLSAATTATVLRAQEGTSARSHISGTKVVAPMTNQAITDLYTQVDTAETNLTNLVNSTVADLNAATTALNDATAATQSVQPVGAITMFGGAAAPAGWVLCDGAAISRTTYSDLFAAIGTTFGIGDGTTTFNVPNLKQRFPIGKTDVGVAAVLGETGGSIDHVHPGPSHTHTGPSHTHTGPSHTHTMGTHLHAGPSHTHTNPSTASSNVTHTHALTTGSAGSHTHSFSDSFTTGSPSVTVGAASGASNVGGSTHTHSGSVSGTTGTGGSHTHTATTGNPDNSSHSHTQGVTGAGGTGNTGSTDPGDTNAGGTGATGSSGTGATGASGTDVTGSANPPYLAVNFIIRTGV